MATYKPGQGNFVRRGTFWSLVVLIVWGGQTLYGFLVSSWAFAAQLLFEDKAPLEGTMLPLIEQRLNWAFVISWAVVAVAILFLRKLLNKPNTAEFLIGTDDELEKVTWPNRKDAWNSSLVVMVFVAFLAGFLLVSDFAIDRVIEFVVGLGGGAS